MSKIYDSEYQIQQDILTKVGGDGNKCFDSQYSILLEILDKIEGGGGGGAVIDDNVISTTTAWSSSKIVSELADAGFNVLVVQTLPATGEAHTLYFVPSADPQTQNAYDEYLYANNAWEQVGSTAVDMSDYYTADEVDALIEDLPHNYIIADADASAGTYSTDISTFYSKTIEENAVQNVKIKIVDEHVVNNTSVYSDSYYLPSSSRIYDSNVELWLMTTEDGASWENIHYLITNNSITRDVSTGTFGPSNYAKLSVLTQAEYDALTTKDSSTLYVISDAQ